MDKQDRLERGQVLARVIIEMLGAPKEHIEKALHMYIEKLGNDEKFSIVNKKLEPAEPAGKMFSVFAELEMWFKNTSELVGFCFDSLPSSVEIIEPASLLIKAPELSGWINDLQARIHKIDMDLKNLKANNMILNTQALRMIYSCIRISLKESPKTFEQLGNLTELKDDLLKQVLDKMAAANEIVLEGNLYKLP